MLWIWQVGTLVAYQILVLGCFLSVDISLHYSMIFVPLTKSCLKAWLFCYATHILCETTNYYKFKRVSRFCRISELGASALFFFFWVYKIFAAFWRRKQWIFYRLLRLPISCPEMACLWCRMKIVWCLTYLDGLTLKLCCIIFCNRTFLVISM